MEQMQSVVLKWILTYNAQTLKPANCTTPTHLLRPLFTIYVEPESEKSERLLKHCFGRWEVGSNVESCQVAVSLPGKKAELKYLC